MLKFKPRLIKKKVQLKEHIIKFEPESKSLFLYDLKGLLLDKKYIDFLINDICIVDDNCILLIKFINIIIKIKIINNSIEINDTLFLKNKRIYDFVYIKESKLLIISFENYDQFIINYRNIIGIWDIDSLLKNPIQIIHNNSPYLFNFNSNLFAAYNYKSISIYQKTNNIQLYQLASTLTLDNNYSYYNLNLIKLDNRTLMVSNNKEIYIIDIRNMMTKQIFILIDGVNEKEFLCVKDINILKDIKNMETTTMFYITRDEIKYLYKKEKDIYLYSGNNLYTIKYNNNNLEIIKKIKKPELKERYYPSSEPLIAKLEDINTLYYDESFKFFSFKNNKIIVVPYFHFYYFPYIGDNGSSEAPIIISKKINVFKSVFKKFERRFTLREAKKYPITFDKRNKFKKINKINTRNNPQKYKKNFK